VTAEGTPTPEPLQLVWTWKSELRDDTEAVAHEGEGRLKGGLFGFLRGQRLFIASLNQNQVWSGSSALACWVRVYVCDSERTLVFESVGKNVESLKAAAEAAAPFCPVNWGDLTDE
jgi:hypothetical protein